MLTWLALNEKGWKNGLIDLVPCHQLADRTVWAEADFQRQAFIYLSDNRVYVERRSKETRGQLELRWGQC